MHAILNIALRAARETASLLGRYLDRPDRIRVLQDNGEEILTTAHVDCERTLYEQLKKTYPQHRYYSSVNGTLNESDANTTWLLSPIIGSTNLLRGTPGFLTSVACRIDNHITVAVCIDPVLNEEFTAIAGNGALFNGRRARVSQESSLADALVGIEYPEPRADNDSRSALTTKLLETGCSVRTTGNGVLDMLYVATGRLDAGLIATQDRIGLDSAALILRESGGLISDLDGNPSLTGNTVAFGNPKCLKQVLQALR